MDDIGRGSYHYLLNGKSAPVTEHWRYHSLPTGVRRVSSQREAPGVTIAVEADMYAGRVQHCDISWLTEATTIEASFTLRDGVIDFQRLRDGVEMEKEQFSETGEGPLLLFPLMRIFTGPLIAKLIHAGGQGRVLLPSIERPDAPDTLLLPRISVRNARLLQEKAELLVDEETVDCSLCEYTGDQYGEGSRFWLAEDDTLLRYQWQQGTDQCWDVWLRGAAG